MQQVVVTASARVRRIGTKSTIIGRSEEHRHWHPDFNYFQEIPQQPNRYSEVYVAEQGRQRCVFGAAAGGRTDPGRRWRQAMTAATSLLLMVTRNTDEVPVVEHEVEEPKRNAPEGGTLRGTPPPPPPSES